MRIFKDPSHWKKIIVILILADIVFFVFSFFSPSLPRLGISASHLKEELFVSLFVLISLYSLLERERVSRFFRSRRFKSSLLIFSGIASLQVLTRVPYLINNMALLNSDRSVLFLMIKNISSGVSFPIYFYGQLYQGSLNAYFYSLIYALIPSLRLSVLIGNILIFSIVVFLSCLLMNKITGSGSFFYSVFILSLPLSGLIFFSNDETRGIPFIVLLEILLIYLVYRVIHDKREGFVLIGVVAGILFWIYQPSTSLMIIIFVWMFLHLLFRRRVLVLVKPLILTVIGFVVGSLPHILAEINNDFINTKVLFFSKNILNNLRALNVTVISNLPGAVLTGLDSNGLISFIVAIFFVSGFVLSVYLAIREKDSRKIYLPVFFVINLVFLLLSRYPPLPRYIVHYRLYSYLTILIAILVFKEIRLFDRKVVKAIFLLCFVLITVWKSAERYPRLRIAHKENTEDIAEIQRIKENIILGNYWHTMRLSPFLDENKLMTAPPSSFRPEGIFSFSKYYPSALRLGDQWESRNKAFIAPDRKKGQIDALLRDLNISYKGHTLPSGEYVLYSDFSKGLSASFYDLLNSNLKQRYEQKIKRSYSAVREMILKIPEPVIDEGRIMLLMPGAAGLSNQEIEDDVFKDWRFVLKKGDKKISFPLEFSKEKISYSFPEALHCESGTYQAYVCFMNMPVHHCGEVECQSIDQNKRLTVSHLSDALSFVPIQDEQDKRRKGLPIDQLKIKLLERGVTSLEFHVYSFFNFESSIWTNRYTQKLFLNEKEIPVHHGDNKIKIEVSGEKEIKLGVKHKTLLHARDSKGNVLFFNTGAILEKIVVHSERTSSVVFPFLREVR